MASSGNVEAVLKPVEVEQPVEACDGCVESGLLGTTTTEESKPMPEEQHDDTTASDVELSASEEPEQQKPLVDKKVEPPEAAADEQESTRERFKRYRREMAGRVWVPELWGQEKLLKDWVDCAVFDRPLVPAGLLTARRALIAECCTRRPDRTSPANSSGSSPLRVQNGYS